MELDLPMYKEAYRNIATSIKELEIPDNKEEIKKLEEVIERNQTAIHAWKKGTYDTSIWLSEELFEENDKKMFEEYAEPYNANIMEAQKMIAELENGMKENQTQLKSNKAKQKELKGYADNARKNAEADYKKARASVVEEWEKSEEKKKYDSNMETIQIINSRRPNLMKAEEEALIRLNGENIKLQQVLGSKLKALEDEYKQFLSDLDEIDREFGLDQLDKEVVEEKAAEEKLEKTAEEPSHKQPSAEEPVQAQPAAEKTEPSAPASSRPTPSQTTPGTSDGQKITTGINLNISKEGTELVVFKKEKEKYLSKPNKGKLSALTKTIGTQDEIIRTEIDKAVASGLLTIDEAKKEIELYEKLIQSDEQKEKETIIDKMKLRVHYNLSGMIRAKISPENRRQMRANAAESLKLGIGDVEPKWMKVVVQAESAWKNSKLSKRLKSLGSKIAGFLPSAKGKENEQQELEAQTGEQQTNTDGRKTDRLGNPIEKTAAQIEAEATAEKVGKVVEKIQNENNGR